MLFHFSSKRKRIWAFCFAVMGRYNMDVCGCCLAFCGMGTPFVGTPFVTAVPEPEQGSSWKGTQSGVSGEMLRFSGQGLVGCFLLLVSFLKCNFPWKLSF